jgi:hypothetical protein
MRNWVFRITALVGFITLGACTREEASARVKGDIGADTIEIIHARFPCYSPNFHFFGYRFRARVQGEIGDGYVCWNFSDQQWSWQILPEYKLSRLNRGN